MYYNIAVTFYVLQFLFEILLLLRQYKHLKTAKVPAFLAEKCGNDAAYSAYSLAKVRFGMFVKIPSFIIGLLSIGWLNKYVWNLALDTIVYMGYNASYEYTRIYIYMLIGMMASLVLSTPFILYSTFVIEEKFGFNKLTLKKYILDQIKSILLSAALLPLGCGGIFIIEWGGDYFYIYLTVFSTILNIAFIPIYHNIIEPWFNVSTQLDANSELGQRLFGLAKRLDFPLSGVYVIDTSTQSGHCNAYCCGFGNNKRIVLYDNLVNELSVDEIEAVICHEIGHDKHNHVVYSMITSQICTIAFYIFYGWVIECDAIFSDFEFENNILMGLIIASTLWSPVECVLVLLQTIMSRHFEYQADLFATQHNLDIVTPLIKLNVIEKSPILYDSWYSMFSNSHPTLLERIDAVQEYKKLD